MKTCVRKRKGAETDIAGGVAKRSWIRALNDHVHNFLDQVKSLFGRPENELPEEPISARDAPSVEHFLQEDEVEEMNQDHSVSPPPPEAESGSSRVEGPSGSVPVHPEVNIQTKDRQQARNEEDQPTRAKDEQRIRNEEQQPTWNDPSYSTPTIGGVGSSGRRSPIQSPREGLLGWPLEAVTSIIPDDFLTGARTTNPKRFARVLVRSHFLVRFSFLGLKFFPVLS
jgi:hypothetical protein